MPGIKSPDKFTPNGDNKELKISDVQTREEQALQLLRKDQQDRERAKGADKSFKERRSASSRYEATADLEESLEKAQGEILQEVLERVIEDPTLDFEELIKEAVTKTDIKALPLPAKEKILRKMGKAASLQKKINKYSGLLAISQQAVKDRNLDGQLTPESKKLAEDMLKASEEKLAALSSE